MVLNFLHDCGMFMIQKIVLMMHKICLLSHLMSEKNHDIEFFDIHGLQNLFGIFSKVWLFSHYAMDIILFCGMRYVNAQDFFLVLAHI